MEDMGLWEECRSIARVARVLCECESSMRRMSIARVL